MLVEPNSSLRAANDELKLRQALEFAGNKVSTVENPDELTPARQGQDRCRAGFVGRRNQSAGPDGEPSGSPTFLRSLTRPIPAELTGRRQARNLLCDGSSSARTSSWYDRRARDRTAREEPPGRVREVRNVDLRRPSRRRLLPPIFKGSSCPHHACHTPIVPTPAALAKSAAALLESVAQKPRLRSRPSLRR